MLSFLFGNYHFTLCRRENTKTHTKKNYAKIFFVLTWGHFYSIGSASTGSTKSATMELYTSSYNETMSGGGETLSSISEKSCISAANHNGQNGTFPTQAYLMVREKILYIYIFIIISFLENTINAISPAWINTERKRKKFHWKYINILCIFKQPSNRARPCSASRFLKQSTVHY